MTAKKDLRYHIVLVTKYRYRILGSEEASYVKSKILEWSEKWNYEVLSCSVEAEHLHLAIKTDAEITVLVGKIKGALAFSLRKKFPKLRRYTIWNGGYYVGSMGEVSQGNIEEYIRSQGFRETETIERVFKMKILPSKRKFGIMDQYVKGVQSLDKTKVPAAMLQRLTGLPENSFKLRNDLSQWNALDGEANFAIRVPGGKKCSTKPFWLAAKGQKLPENFSVRDSYIMRRGKEWFVHLTAREERVINRFSPQSLISIDLGVKQPVTSVTCEVGQIKKVEFWGKELKRQIWLREKRRASLQAASAKYGWEVNPRATIKYQRRIEDLLHKFTKNLVGTAKEASASIAIGNLLGVRDKSKHQFGPKSNNESVFQLHKMPFGKLKSMLQYKAHLAGVSIVFADERNTSKTCSKCGHCDSNNRRKRNFSCQNCGYNTHADLNGAMNIARQACRLSGHDTALLRTLISSSATPACEASLGNPIL